MLYDKGIGIRNINTRFYYRRTDKHVYLTLHKLTPYLRQILLTHLAVRNADSCLRHELVYLRGAMEYAFYIVVHIINLPAAAEFFFYSLCDYSRIVFKNICGYRVSVKRSFLYYGHITNTRHGHIESSRYGSCRKS